MLRRTCRFQSECFIYALLYFGISNLNIFIIYKYAWRIFSSIFSCIPAQLERGHVVDVQIFENIVTE